MVRGVREVEMEAEKEGRFPYIRRMARTILLSAFFP
jgi:hypothetical protein